MGTVVHLTKFRINPRKGLVRRDRSLLSSTRALKISAPLLIRPDSKQRECKRLWNNSENGGFSSPGVTATQNTTSAAPETEPVPERYDPAGMAQEKLKRLAKFYIKNAAQILSGLGKEEIRVGWLLEECHDMLDPKLADTNGQAQLHRQLP